MKRISKYAAVLVIMAAAIGMMGCQQSSGGSNSDAESKIPQLDLRIKKNGVAIKSRAASATVIESCDEPYEILKLPAGKTKEDIKGMIKLEKDSGGIKISLDLDEFWVKPQSETNKDDVWYVYSVQPYWIDSNGTWNSYLELRGETLETLNRTGKASFIYPLAEDGETLNLRIQLGAMKTNGNEKHDFHGYYKVTAGGGIGLPDAIPSDIDSKNYIVINEEGNGCGVKNLIPVEADYVCRDIGGYGQESATGDFSWDHWFFSAVIEIENNDGITPIKFDDYPGPFDKPGYERTGGFKYHAWGGEISTDCPYFALDYSYRYYFDEYPDLEFHTKNFQSGFVKNEYFKK